MVIKCDSCNKEVTKIKRVGNEWLCVVCSGNFIGGPQFDSMPFSGHVYRNLKHYGKVSEARLRMMMRRTKADDGITIIDRQTGKESQNY